MASRPNSTAALVFRHRFLFIKCLLLLLAVRFTLSTRGYKAVLGWIETAQPSRKRALSPQLLTWTIETAARFIPGASCLTRALALRYLLAQAAVDACIEIGVRTTESGTFKAHAWVKMDDGLITNDTPDNIARYKVIAAL